jgi:hypothetical protein
VTFSTGLFETFESIAIVLLADLRLMDSNNKRLPIQVEPHATIQVLPEVGFQAWLLQHVTFFNVAFQAQLVSNN